MQRPLPHRNWLASQVTFKQPFSSGKIMQKGYLGNYLNETAV
jgi:hypothetical protein